MELEEQSIVYEGDVVENDELEDTTVDPGALLLVGGLVVGAAIAVKTIGPKTIAMLRQKRLERAYKLIEAYTAASEQEANEPDSNS